MADFNTTVRSYEISVWTLQDECLTVLKPSELEFKGEVLNAVATFVDDGTEELTFSVPMYYYNDYGKKVLNPAWSYILNGHFTANMHKVKLILNKATEDEKVYEMLIVNVAQSHEKDLVKYDIKCEGLAFHELGKIGYKISLSSEEFEEEYRLWFEDDQPGEPPHATIQYWNDKIFKYTDGSLKYAWDYEVCMDWSSYSLGANRDPSKVYEEEYISSWTVDPFEYILNPKTVEGNKEKWRQLDEEESNIYNLTQTIAEKFGVYCRYEYLHDANYHIIGRKVIYYNSSFKELEGYTDLTYPYNTARVERTIDNTDLITKLFVRPVESDSSSSNLISITTVDGNPSKEDYLLNFDYLHEVHTITDDLYELIPIYEGKLREINESAVAIETQISLLLDELIKARANYTTYTNAIKLDRERILNVKSFIDLLTGGDEVINITATNPERLPLHAIASANNSYYAEVKIDGILPETVELYTTINYSKHENAGRLTGLVTTYKFEYDEFNNLCRITNIRLPQISLDTYTCLYMVCDYSPKLYYQNVLRVWLQRLADDQINAAKAEETVRQLELMLYSADSDYTHADYCIVDAASVDTNKAMEVLRSYPILAGNPAKLDFNNHNHPYIRTAEGLTVTVNLYRNYVAGINSDEGIAVIVSEYLPDGTLYNGAQSMATSYANHAIDLSTRLDNTLYCFSDIYIVTIYSKDANDFITALVNYDTLNINSPCVLFGNGVVDNSYVLGTNSYGYIDKAFTEEAHGYCALYDFLLELKYKIITEFERMMGPALREGYWQADDYNDYGNKYNDSFNINYRRQEYTGDAGRTEITFAWDTNNVFTEETNSYYEVGINLTKLYHLMVNLQPYMSRLINYTDNLCYIYYDKLYLELNDEIAELQAVYNSLLARVNSSGYNSLSADELITYDNYHFKATNGMWDDAIARNNMLALRWFEIGAQCEFGFVWKAGNANERTAIPVLILTGIRDLTEEEYLSIIAADDLHRPFIGTVNSQVVTEVLNNVSYSYVRTETTSLLHSGEQLSYVYINPDDITDKYHPNYMTQQGETYIPTIYGYETVYNSSNNPNQLTLAYPRFKINSLELKNNSLDILIAMNGYNLEYNKDFYVLLQLDAADRTHKYFITIKPEVFFKYYKISTNASPATIRINYSTSNANEAIYLDAIKVMKENAYPKVSYNIGLDVLNPKMIRTAYNKLRSIVHINDYELLLEKTTGYISKITLDLDSPKNDSVEIKNYETKFEDLFSTIVAQTEAMKKNENTISIAAAAFSPTGMIYGSVLQDSILKADLSYSFNQGRLTIDEENGIWGISDSGVVAFRGGGIFTATTKSADGEWEWNTGILPSGINADLITTGQLDTNRIRIYAGDRVSFQMNGEGIFAYKTFAKDYLIGMDDSAGSTYETYMAGRENDIVDAMQYVTYNENGLFLVVKEGAKVLNELRNGFIDILTDVNRVEISWDGLLLRNWSGERTLWADPDTGDLHLRGIIEAEGGKIGSWTITKTGFEGQYILFLNNENDANSNGIFLRNSTAADASIVTYNNTLYYACKMLGSNTLYYTSNPNDHSTGNGETLLVYQMTPVSCKPRYTTTEAETIRVSTGLVYDELTGELVTQYTTLTYNRTYVADAQGNKILYANLGIIFNGSDSLDSNWHRALMDLRMNNDTYVSYVKTSLLQTYSAPANKQITIDTYTPTFSVKAKTGYVTMNSGSLGAFSLTSTELSGNKTGSNNTENWAVFKESRILNCNITNSTIEGYSLSNYGSVINNIWGDSSAGTINFSRVSGDTGNFNIADMLYYKTNISAALVINDMSYSITSNGTNSSILVTATTATSNINTSYTKELKFDIGSVWSDGNSTGWTTGHRDGWLAAAGNVGTLTAYRSGEVSITVPTSYNQTGSLLLFIVTEADDSWALDASLKVRAKSGDVIIDTTTIYMPDSSSKEAEYLTNTNSDYKVTIKAGNKNYTYTFTASEAYSNGWTLSRNALNVWNNGTTSTLYYYDTSELRYKAAASGVVWYYT